MPVHPLMSALQDYSWISLKLLQTFRPQFPHRKMGGGGVKVKSQRLLRPLKICDVNIWAKCQAPALFILHGPQVCLWAQPEGRPPSLSSHPFRRSPLFLLCEQM